MFFNMLFDSVHIVFATILGMMAICGCRQLVKKLKKQDWRECCCCGHVGRAFGEIPSFTLGVLVHRVHGFPLKAPLVVRITAGSESEATSTSKTGVWNEEIRLNVKQGVQTIIVSICDPRERILAKANLDVQFDLQKCWDEEKGIIHEKHIQVLHHGKAKGSVLLSFSRDSFMAESAPLLKNQGLDTNNISGPLANLLVESSKAVKKSRLLAESSKAKLSVEETEPQTAHAKSMQKLEVLAGAIQGPVMKTGSWGYKHEKYLKVFMSKRGKHEALQWHMGLWDDKLHVEKEGLPPQKCVPMMRITAVYADSAKADHFVIRYATENERKELILKKVDRERDTWVEAIKLFIQELRKERGAFAKSLSENAGLGGAKHYGGTQLKVPSTMVALLSSDDEQSRSQTKKEGMHSSGGISSSSDTSRGNRSYHNPQARHVAEHTKSATATPGETTMASDSDVP